MFLIRRARLTLRASRWGMPPLIFSVPFVVLTAATFLLSAKARTHLGYAGLSLVPGAVVILLAAAMGVARIATRHPAFRRPYFQWLMSTPWDPSKPLPLGPIYLNYRDLIVLLGIAFLPSWHSVLFAAWVLAAYVAGYCFIAALTACLLGQRWWSYLLIFLLGLQLVFWDQPWVLLLVVMASAAIAVLGLKATLRRLSSFSIKQLNVQDVQLFSEAGLTPVVTKVDAARKPGQPDGVGWPWNRLSRHSPRSILSAADSILIGVLAGWYFVVFTHIMSAVNEATYEDAEGTAAAGFFVLVTIGAAIRAGVYVYACRPPISLLGRLATKRILLPEYDKSLAPSAIAIAVAAVTFVIDSPYWLLSAIIGIAVAILIGAPPALAVWQLTGRHRIPEPDAQTKNTRLISIK
jgi:hypothetical protein